MTEEILLGLAGMVVLGVLAQWIAWRVGLPSILLLLIFGFIAGPITGFIDPDAIFGDVLFPLVSFSVAIILFEGGLSLKFSELKETGSVVHRLITIGALIAWFLTAAASRFVLGLEAPFSALLGAILVVSGPTVVIPLLRHVRPAGKVASVLRWEGILIDPVGALLAVLVYEAILGGRFGEMGVVALSGILKTLFIGGLLGGLGALFMVLFLKRYWIPDFLQSPVTLMVVIAVFTISNILRHESGLLTVTVMGIVLASQSTVKVRHIIEFKENLRVLLISGLFILLAARLDTSDINYLSLKSLVFLAVLVTIVRPASVFASTLGSELKWRERLFISLMYPRGIVAAAVASVFALGLTEAGHPQAEMLVPLTFMVIVGTVAVYGLGARFAARWLGVEQPSPQGVLIVGAHPWAVLIAKALMSEGFRVLVTDTNWYKVRAARMEGVPVYYGSILSESIFQEIDLEGIGKLLAITPNDSVNSLAALHFEDEFSSSEVYQLRPQGEDTASTGAPKHLHGRYLFGPDIDYQYLARRFAKGAVIKKTNITEEFGFDSFRKMYGEEAVPLFLITEDRRLVVFTTDMEITPKPGQTILSLVDEVKEEEKKDAGSERKDKTSVKEKGPA